MRRFLVRLRFLWLAISVFLGAPTGFAQQAPREYVVPAALFSAIAQEYSGEKALENVSGITQFHRVQASPGFTQAREWVVAQLQAAGITEIGVEKFPSDGRVRYSTHVAPMAWTVRQGELWAEAPFRENLCRFTEKPVCLSTLSNGGEWRGAAVDVGAGTDAASYAGKEVAGKIVFASGYAGAVHREAVLRRGALGVVIYPAAGDRADRPDLVRYNGLWIQGDEKEKATFGFQISHRQWAHLKPHVESGKLLLRAKVDAELHPGNLEVTSAFLRGSDPAREIILVAHLDHYRFGANDNASGSAAVLEAARTVKTLLDQGKITPLKFTLRFLWVPEHFGTVAWLGKHPEIRDRAIAALNLDMVGEEQFKTNSRMNIARTPGSRPSFLNSLVENVAYQVDAANLVAPSGSRNLFHWRMTPYTSGSDHDMFNDSNVGVPSVQFGHWPDWTHHTDQDSPDKVDPTTLKRVGVMATSAAVWMATAGDVEWMKLAGQTVGSAFGEMFSPDTFSSAATMGLDPQTPGQTDSAKVLRQTSFRMGGMGLRAWMAAATTDSIKPFLSERARSNLAVVAMPLEMMRTMMGNVPRSFGQGEPPASMKRVPRHTFIGPIADGPSSLWFREALQTDWEWWQKQSRALPAFDLMVYEACNFADGKRTLTDIENALGAEFGDVPEGFVEGLFDRLAKIGLAEFVEKKN